MNEHKHASVLRAIADGVPLSEFEITSEGWISKTWECLHGYATWITDPDDYEIRRKPQYIMVNGFKVPKPLDTNTAPNSINTVYWPYLTYESLWDSALPSNGEAKLSIQRGCAHTTKEAAIAHAKAMLGIDPKWEE